MTESGQDVVVALEGGPDSLPRTLSIRWKEGTSKIKVPHLNGHEHFELVGPHTPDLGRPVFRWADRTKVAE